MKKVLLVMLALAVAGGSAFAQGWTFNGHVSGGIGLFFPDEGENDTSVMPIGNNGAGQPFRTHLNSAFVNADGNAGLDFSLRAHGGAGGAQAVPNEGVFFDRASGWLSFSDNSVQVHGGWVNNGFFETRDRMFADDAGEGLGLLTILRPAEGFALGFGAFSQGTGALTFAGENNTSQPLGTLLVRFDSDDFVITGGLRNSSFVDNNQWGADVIPTTRDAGSSMAYVSFGWTADPDMHLAFTGVFMNLEEFGDFGVMRYFVTFAHSGLVDNMTLHAGGSFGMSMEDDAEPHVWIWAGVDFEVSEAIVPRLHLHYVMGGVWDHTQRIHTNSIRNGITFTEDTSFLSVNPSVRFRIAPSAFVELGGLFHIDLGDVSTFGAWGDDFPGADTNNIGIYALMQVSF